MVINHSMVINLQYLESLKVENFNIIILERHCKECFFFTFSNIRDRVLNIIIYNNCTGQLSKFLTENCQPDPCESRGSS